MSDRTEKAKQLFTSGYNCSQAVISVFCEEIGLDLDTALRLSSSFGGGMGRLREVCGAVSAMFMVVGLKYGYVSPTDSVGKAEHYKLIQQLAEEFRLKNGSIVCRELLKLKTQRDSAIPTERTAEYYKSRPCAQMVSDAVEIVENYLKQRGDK